MGPSALRTGCVSRAEHHGHRARGTGWQRHLARVRATLVATLATLLVACGGPSDPTLELHDGRLSSDEEIVRVRVIADGGAPILDRLLPAPVRSVRLDGIPGGQSVRVEAVFESGRSGTLVVKTEPERGRLRVRLEAPLGQSVIDAAGEHTVPVLAGTTMPGAFHIEASAPGVATVLAGEVQATHTFVTAGERWHWPFSVQAGESVRVQVDDDGPHTITVIRAEAVPEDELRSALQLVDRAFPADVRGEPDPGRTSGRIELASPALAAFVRRFGQSLRVRDPEIPWAYEGVTLRAAPGRDVHVLLQLHVEDADGRPLPAFRPPTRDDATTGGGSIGIVRVPAGGEAVAVLPVFLDDRIAETGLVQRRLTIRPLGAAQALLDDRRSTWVDRPPSWVWTAFLGSVLAGIVGGVTLLIRLGPVLRRQSATEAVTLALFAGLRFAVSTVSQLSSILLAAALGPLAPIVVGAFDDTLRGTILAVLFSLIRRPGVGSTLVLLSSVMGWLTLGGLQPADILFVGCHALWLEGAAWLSGVTRGEDRGPPSTGRLWATIVPASALSVLTGISLHVVLYRLHFAPWYATLAVLTQGLLYPALGVWLSRPLVRALREMTP